MRNAGFALAITLVGIVAVGHALVELTLATRPRLERILARAYRGWHQ